MQAECLFVDNNACGRVLTAVVDGYVEHISLALLKQLCIALRDYERTSQSVAQYGYVLRPDNAHTRADRLCQRDLDAVIFGDKRRGKFVRNEKSYLVRGKKI